MKTSFPVSLSLLFLLLLSRSVNSEYCTCSCCRGDPCSSKVQGSFPLDPCTSFECYNRCPTKYPQNCPVDGQGGLVQGQCTSIPPSATQRIAVNHLLVPLSFLFVFLIDRWRIKDLIELGPLNNSFRRSSSSLWRWWEEIFVQIFFRRRRGEKQFSIFLKNEKGE